MRVGHAAAAIVLACALGCAASSGGQDQAQSKQVLDGVYMPSFPPVPAPASTAETIDTLAADWRNGGARTIASDVFSLQGLILAVSFGVLLAVGWSRRGPGSRNRELLLLCASGALFFDVMRFFRVLHSPAYLRLMDWVFTAIVGVGLLLITRAVYRVVRPARASWTPNLRTPVLAGLALVLLCANLWLVLARTSDDAGFFVNLGAQRLRERGRLPYGDPMLTGTPGAAYGPLLYAAHVPFQILLAPHGVNRVSPPRLDPASGAVLSAARAGDAAGGDRVSPAGRRRALPCRSPVRGYNGRPRAGLSLHRQPCGAGDRRAGRPGCRDDIRLAHRAGGNDARGARRAAPAGAVGRPAGRGRRRGVLSRVHGTGVAGLLLARSRAAPGVRDRRLPHRRSRRQAPSTPCRAPRVHARGSATIIYDTFGHHTDPAGYGSSPFGFWGQRGGIRRVLPRRLPEAPA